MIFEKGVQVTKGFVVGVFLATAALLAGIALGLALAFLAGAL